MLLPKLSAFCSTLLVGLLCLSPLLAHSEQAEGNGGETLHWRQPVLSAQMPIIGSHARHTNVVVEGLDSGKFLNAENLEEGLFQVRLSNPTAVAEEVTLSLRVKIPDKSGLVKVLLPTEPIEYSLQVEPGVTAVVQFPFVVSQSLWDTLCKRTAGFGLGMLDFTLLAVDATGNAISPLVDVAHVGFAPPRTEPLTPPEVSVVMHQGAPALKINGSVEPGNFAYIGWNWGLSRQTIREFAAEGRHLYRIVFQPWSLWRDGKFDPERFETRMNELVASIVGNDPEALIYIFWWLHTPRNWADHFPGETIIYDDGTNATPHPLPDQQGWPRPSLSSRVWLEQQDAIMREASKRLLDGAYADRVFGVSAGYGNGGEWNGYGYHGGRFSDYSEPAQQDFQLWLKDEYPSLGALNAKWKTAYRDWSEIAVPEREMRLSQGWGSFTGPDFPAQVTDYHRFTGERTVALIEHFSRLFKEESGGRWLVGHFYGYFGSHLSQPPYHALDSGHFMLGRLLESDAVDFIAYPYGYADRRRNMALGNAIASVQAAGKLYVVECDLATHLNAKSQTPILAHHEGGLHDPESSLTAYRRDFARVSAGRLSAWWYDFGRGWYQFPGWTDFVGKVEQVRAWQREHSQESVAQVAVILDEQSALHAGPHSSAYGKMLYNTLSYELDEAGAPWEAFLATDIDRVVEGDYKVIILLNPVENASALAEKLRNTDASLVWGYGTGLLEDKGWTNNPQAGTTGLKAVAQPQQETGPILYSRAVPALPARGTVAQQQPPGALRPRIRISDNRATPLARYADGGVAVASFPRGSGGQIDYLLGTPQLEKQLLATIYDQAGVHRYTKDGSAAYANASSVSVWRQSGGATRITLPKKASVIRDAWSGQIVGRDTDTIEVSEVVGHSTDGFYLLEY